MTATSPVPVSGPPPFPADSIHKPYVPPSPEDVIEDLQEGDEVEVTFRGTAAPSEIFKGEFRVRIRLGRQLGVKLLDSADSVKILKRVTRKFEHSAMYYDPESCIYWVRGSGYFKSFSGSEMHDINATWNDSRARLLKVTPPSEVDGT